ncbi:hypothetical protein [Microbacterium oxydans]|uniref:hypothetical protein n=1 Tax=Microbacterium oxydans TaxID=82380 RepID=UPI00367324B6
MAIYWVNYDLRKSGQNYAGLTKYLESFPWAKPLASSYFVETNLTSVALRDGIRHHIDDNDAVVVVEASGTNWATVGVVSEVNDWLLAKM